MAYYSSPKHYETTTGKAFTTKCSSIHRTGSDRGMVKLGFWDKDSDKVRYGNYIYQQPQRKGPDGVFDELAKEFGLPTDGVKL